MDAKPIFKSKTFNVNAVLVGIVGILSAFGIDLPSGLYESMLAVIPLTNIVLRLMTKSAVTLTGAPNNRGSVHPVVLFLLFSATTLMAGCGLFDKMQTRADTSNAELREQYCDGGASIILDYIPNAKQADLLLQVADYEMLRNNQKLVPEVTAFLANARENLQNGALIITGHDAVVYMTEHIQWLKDDDGQRLFYISQLAEEINLPDPFSACDRKLLLMHIDNVERKVLPYVVQ